jgi:hypothetical protein
MAYFASINHRCAILDPLPAYLSMSGEVQLGIVLFIVAGALGYLLVDLWRAWRGQSGCGSACHRCSSRAVTLQDVSTSQRYPLSQI